MSDLTHLFEATRDASQAVRELDDAAFELHALDSLCFRRRALPCGDSVIF